MGESRFQIHVAPSPHDPGGVIARRAAARLAEILEVISRVARGSVPPKFQDAFERALLSRVSGRASAGATELVVQYDAADHCAAMREVGICDTCAAELPAVADEDGSTRWGPCACGGPCDPTYRRCQQTAGHPGKCAIRGTGLQQYSVDLTVPLPEEAAHG